MYSYRVIEVRENMASGQTSGEKLEKVLNEQGAQGWQLKAIIAVEISVTTGPSGVERLLVTFERQA